MSEAFELSAEGGVGLLRICRPEKHNALTAQMMDDLSALCRHVESRDDIHVLIVTGTGRIFCAGGDIEAWSERSARSFAQHWLRDGHEVFDRLARLRQPVIAVLNGHALGGGLELAACADYRIAEAHIKIGQPETGLGIIAGWSGTQRAVRRFGAQAVRRMALFGEVLSAQDALAAGIVDRISDTGDGLRAARGVAASLLGKGRVASELTKMLVNSAEGEEGGRTLEALAGWIAADSQELREGVAAFKEKRKPDFKV